MTTKFCPGSMAIKSPTPEYIACTKCGSEVEIWSDEVKAKCGECQTINYRDRLPSCIDWCRYAEQCIGTEAYARLKKMVDAPAAPANK